jgi:orotate phosphoribosyltransferase-like protein
MNILSDLSYDIEQLYIEGMSNQRIAKELNIGLEVVEGWLMAQSLSNDQTSDYDPYNTVNS